MKEEANIHCVETKTNHHLLACLLDPFWLILAMWVSLLVSTIIGLIQTGRDLFPKLFNTSASVSSMPMVSSMPIVESLNSWPILEIQRMGFYALCLWFTVRAALKYFSSSAPDRAWKESFVLAIVCLAFAFFDLVIWLQSGPCYLDPANSF